MGCVAKQKPCLLDDYEIVGNNLEYYTYVHFARRTHTRWPPSREVLKEPVFFSSMRSRDLVRLSQNFFKNKVTCWASFETPRIWVWLSSAGLHLGKKTRKHKSMEGNIRTSEIRAAVCKQLSVSFRLPNQENQMIHVVVRGRVITLIHSVFQFPLPACPGGA